MKKKATVAVGVIATLFVICFAIISFKSHEEATAKVEPIEMETISPKPNAGSEHYAIKAGGPFGSEESINMENLWVDFEPEEVSEKLSEEEQLLIDEVVSKIPIRQSVEGLTKEEFVRKMERLDDLYNSSIFSQNAEIFFDVAQEEGYNEYFFPANALIETSGGKFLHGDFNYCNMTQTVENEDGELMTVYKEGRPLFRNFESGEECIREFFVKVNKYKEYNSDTTLTGFTAIWAPNTALHPHQAEYYAISLYEHMLQISNL